MTNPSLLNPVQGEKVSSFIADAFNAATIAMAGFLAMVTLAAVV